MRKFLIVLVLTAFAAGGVSAQVLLSFGAGVMYDRISGNGFRGTIYDSFYSTYTEISEVNHSVGGFMFFDAGFFETSISFSVGLLTGYTDKSNPVDIGNQLQVGLSFLGKFPFDLGGFVLYPAVGVDYNIVFIKFNQNGNILNFDNGSTAELFSQIGILAGLGFDVKLKSTIYIRTQVLFNLRFPSKYTKEHIKFLESTTGFNFNSTVGVGFRIKTGIGFRF